MTPPKATALDMLEDGFPHGTVDGYTAGCRTNHCPAPIRCAVFKRRYDSDYGFRKRVDAGWTVAELAAEDARKAAEAVEAARVERANAARARQAEAARLKRRNTPKRDPRAGISPKRWTLSEEQKLRELHAEGLLDRQIGERLGRHMSVVCDKRLALGLPKNRRRKVIVHGTAKGYAAGCRTDCPADVSCLEAAKANWRDLAAAHRAGIPVDEWRKQQVAA